MIFWKTDSRWRNSFRSRRDPETIALHGRGGSRASAKWHTPLGNRAAKYVLPCKNHMNNGMAYRASVCRWLLAQVKLTWASPWQQLLRLPAGRYPTNLYFAADLTFSPSLSLPRPSPFSLCLSVALTRKHTYTLSSSLYLLPSSSVTHSAMSLPRSLTYSLEPHPHLYSFRLRLTTSIRALRFSSFLLPKERTDFGIRHGVSSLNSCDTISFGFSIHFSIRFHNLLWLTMYCLGNGHD